MSNYFTADNTGGFSDDDLDALNQAHAWLIDEAPELEAYSIGDALNNAWIEGADAYYLYRTVGHRLGIVELTAHEQIELRREGDRIFAASISA